jgi:phosphinothricin acetyltransferase
VEQAGLVITLRAASPADAGAIAAIYAPHVVDGTASFETDPPDLYAMLARMAASQGLYPWIVAAAGGEVVGFAYAAAFHPREAYRWCAETTVYVADGAQRRGVGRRLYGALIDTLRAQGFTQAVARIALPGEASVVLHQACGFAPVGVQHAVGYKHGRWIDVGLWQRALAEPATPPAEPRRFAEVGLA